MDIFITRGDTPSFTFTVLDPANPLPNGRPSPVNLTGASITFTARETVDAGTATVVKTTADGITILPQLGTDIGKCRVDLDNADTASLVLPQWLTDIGKLTYKWRLPYDLQVVLGGKITTPARGLLVIGQEMTTAIT